MNIKRGLIRRWNKWTSPFVRLFALCFKRDETLVIYGGALDLFIDNTKYLFIYNNSHHPEYKHIWLTRKQQTFKKLIELGYCVVKSNSFRGLYYTLTAGTVFYDNQINDFTTHNLTTGAKRIELWHGLPLKLWGVALTTNVRPYNPKSLLVEKLYKRHSWGEYCVSTSKKLHDIYSYSFEIPLQNVILSTNPRVSILLMDEQNRLDFIARYEQKKLQLFYTMLKSNQNRKIVYMPTFRDQDKFSLCCKF